MSSESPSPAIYTSLAAVFGEISALERAGYNEHNRYDYITIEDIYSEVRKAISKHGVIFQPNISKVSFTYKDKNAKTFTSVVVDFKMRFIATDGSMVESDWYGEAVDTSDKALSKAISGSVKSFLKSMFLLSSEGDKQDDPDNSSPEGVNRSETPKTEPEKVTEWSAKLERTIRTSDSYHEFREICVGKGHDPIDVAKDAFDSGVTVKTDLMRWAEDLQNVGPIELSTITKIDKLLNELGYGKVDKLNKSGEQAIRESLDLEPDATIPKIRTMTEEEGLQIARNLATIQQSQASE